MRWLSASLMKALGLWLTKFAECFRQVNFDDKTFMPCYGLAENALAVSFSDEGSGVVVNEVDRDILEYQGKAVAPGAETRAVSTFVNCGNIRAKPSRRVLKHAPYRLSSTAAKRCRNMALKSAMKQVCRSRNVW